MSTIKSAINNPIAINLAMVLLMLWGLVSLHKLPREVLPEFDFGMINITVVYPSASPEEVEEGICVKIEEAISHLRGIESLSSTAREGMGSVTVYVASGYDARILKEDIERSVAQILTFPEDAEKPNITEVILKQQIVFVAVYGEVSEESLKKYADLFQDELLSQPDFSTIEVMGTRSREITIELSSENLLKYNLDYDRVRSIIQQSSLNLPAGLLRSEQGEILIRTDERNYTGEQFGEIVILTEETGNQVRLKHIANIRDDFGDLRSMAFFNGVPAVCLQVFKTGNQDIIALTNKVEEFVKRKQQQLPSAIKIKTWLNMSGMVEDRLNLLKRNALSGLVLVFIALTLFLHFKVALFVALGIPITFLGCFIFMSAYDQSLNMLSMFAMILVLGIVVDDAVVISESIYQKLCSGEKPLSAAYSGTTNVFLPVLASVSTTIVAFLPLGFVEGRMGLFIAALPFVVIIILLMSLLESIFILPGHIAHHVKIKKEGQSGFLAAQHRILQNKFDWFVKNIYVRIVQRCLRFRYAVSGFVFLLLMLTIGLVAGGRVRIETFPEQDGDFIQMSMEFPTGTDFSYTRKYADYALQKLLATEKQMQTELADTEAAFPFIEHTFSFVGGGDTGKAIIFVELLPSEDRNIFYRDIVHRWQENIGEIPELRSINFAGGGGGGPGGSSLTIELKGNNQRVVEELKQELRQILRRYSFVKNIRDSVQPGKMEAKVNLNPLGVSMGLNAFQIARSVQGAFFGHEVSRIQRGKDEVRVYVKKPLEQRQSFSGLDDLYVDLADGEKLSFSQVAELEFRRGYSSIIRTDRMRALSLIIDIDTKSGNIQELIGELNKNIFPDLRKKYPEVIIGFEGSQRDNAKSMQSLFRGFLIAILTIYIILAGMFRSYLQPLIIMVAIPFGFVGSVWGHMLLGENITMMSMFGLVALAGIVVNNSLILVDFMNRRIRAGTPFLRAVSKAGQERFRAIFLTSVTTILGVTPLLFERSMQALFLKPTVISLTFGLFTSTVFTLILVPAIYTILYDIYSAVKGFYHGKIITRDSLIVSQEALD